MISYTLQNELKNKYSPEGSELRFLQNNLLILLQYFDKLCKDNNINYWLSSGSCLGAVRHKGFIPWDDDIDVEMLREDYLKFEKIFKANEDFVLQTYRNDLYYTEPFAKLRLRKTFVDEGRLTPLYKNKGIFLDIFVMERSNKFIASLCHLILGSLRHLSYRFNTPSYLSDILFAFLKRMSFGVVNCMRAFSCFSNKNKLRHTIGTGVVKNIRVKSELFPLKEILFEGRLYPVPGNTDSYLRRIFGNYMEIPKTIHTHSLKKIEFLSESDYDKLKEM